MSPRLLEAAFAILPISKCFDRTNELEAGRITGIRRHFALDKQTRAHTYRRDRLVSIKSQRGR